jgi:hypothetical protein
MENNMFSSSVEKVDEEVIKNIAKAVGKVTPSVGEPIIRESNENVNFKSSEFKVCSNALPEKTGFWTKVKNVMFYEIKVELTPHQQKVEDEINEFLHQEVSLKKVIDFFFKEITFGKKKEA